MDESAWYVCLATSYRGQGVRNLCAHPKISKHLRKITMTFGEDIYCLPRMNLNVFDDPLTVWLAHLECHTSQFFSIP